MGLDLPGFNNDMIGRTNLEEMSIKGIRKMN